LAPAGRRDKAQAMKLLAAAFPEFVKDSRLHRAAEQPDLCGYGT
jgi:hypothetical protein